MIGIFDKVFTKNGSDVGKKWVRFSVCINGKWASTFDTKLGEKLKSMIGKKVEIEAKENDAGYTDIISIIDLIKNPTLF